MNRSLKIILSVPRTVWFNFRYLPFKDACKLPIWIANNVCIKSMWRGGIKLNNVSTGIIRIGYHEADAVDIFSTKTIIDIRKGGYVKFKADAHIGHGALLCVKQNGVLSLGDNFAISGTTRIVCTDNITIGNDVQFSWDSLIMDSDAHHIIMEDGTEAVNTKRITIGNTVWIASNCTILKGTSIGDNCVVASNSLLNKSYEASSIIGGIPAKTLKHIKGWYL